MSYCYEKELIGHWCLRWDQCSWCRDDYREGLVKPNYPVPAIVTTVQFAADMVSITEWHSEYTDTLFLT